VKFGRENSGYPELTLTKLDTDDYIGGDTRAYHNKSNHRIGGFSANVRKYCT